MKTLRTKPHLSDDELKKIVNNQTSVRAYKDWLIIQMVQSNYGKKAEEISDILGVSKAKIYNVIQTYNNKGVGWRTFDNWGGRRETRCIMSLEEEKAILEEITEEAISGGILTYKHIKSKVESKTGFTVSDDYIWDLFKRHNWVKKVPRQSHPKSNKEEQEDFKKNLKRYWQPRN